MELAGLPAGSVPAGLQYAVISIIFILILESVFLLIFRIFRWLVGDR